ncbi:putative cytochrome c oxidase assembly protein CtaG/Cox11 [Plasmopara halstedii]
MRSKQFRVIRQGACLLSSTSPFFLRPTSINGLRCISRHAAEQARRDSIKKRNRRAVIYLAGTAIAWVGISYAAVPLYKIFCQMTGFGGTTQRAEDFTASKLTPREDAKPIRVTFDGGVSANMPWVFRPQQRDILLVPGETALAFYTAKNKSDKAITGVATYNVYPPSSGVYFNKIQCFCFEEQRLKPNEEIDMPVFFFIDPEICDDPFMNGVHNITLSYTFFKTDDINEEDVDDESTMASKDDHNDDEIREQDRFLPTANISRIMKVSLPSTAKIAKDGKETVQECVSEFISFITSEASDKCQQEKRKTINGDDIIWAMSTLGFDSYVEPLKLYLQKYRESVKVEKNDKKDNVGSFGASS